MIAFSCLSFCSMTTFVLYHIIKNTKKIEYPIYKIGDSLIVGISDKEEFNTLPHDYVDFFEYSQLLTDGLKPENDAIVQLEKEKEKLANCSSIVDYFFFRTLVHRRQNHIYHRIVLDYTKKSKQVTYLDSISEESEIHFRKLLTKAGINNYNPIYHTFNQKIQMIFLNMIVFFFNNTPTHLSLADLLSKDEDLVIKRNNFWFDHIHQQIKTKKTLISLESENVVALIPRLKETCNIQKFNYKTKQFESI